MDKQAQKVSIATALLSFFTPDMPFYKKRSHFRMKPTTKNRFSYYQPLHPYQGEQEKARRRIQIERGILNSSNM